MKRGLKIAGGALLAVALTWGAVDLYLNYVRHRFATVAPGRVYRAAEMPVGKLMRVVENHGIRTVIDFRYEGPDVAAERQALESKELNHVHLPCTQSPSVETMDAFLEVFDDEENYPVLIHCRHGVGRAPMFSAIYRIEHEGWSPERARREAKWFTSRGSFALDGHHGQYILNWVTRQERAELQEGASAELPPVEAAPAESEVDESTAVVGHR